jgi:hypothetical protein
VQNSCTPFRTFTSAKKLPSHNCEVLKQKAPDFRGFFIVRYFT